MPSLASWLRCSLRTVREGSKTLLTTISNGHCGLYRVLPELGQQRSSALVARLSRTVEWSCHFPDVHPHPCQIFMRSFDSSEVMKPHQILVKAMRRVLSLYDINEVTASGEFTLPAGKPSLFPGGVYGFGAQLNQNELIALKKRGRESWLASQSSRASSR